MPSGHPRSDQGLRCPLPETLDITEYINREQGSDLNLHILHRLEDTFFFLDAAQIIIIYLFQEHSLRTYTSIIRGNMWGLWRPLRQRLYLQMSSRQEFDYLQGLFHSCKQQAIEPFWTAHLLHGFICYRDKDIGLYISRLIQMTNWWYFYYFLREQVLTFHANFLHWRQFAWTVKTYFLETEIINKYFSMSSADFF